MSTEPESGAVLRPKLYYALRRKFGEVRVANQGEAMVAYLGSDEKGRSFKSTSSKYGNGLTAGEHYIVRCPFCHDKRFRLYIGHMWGKFDPQTGTRNLWLAHCHNEGCLDGYDQQRSLLEHVFSDGDPHEPDHVTPGRVTPYSPEGVKPPGLVLPLDRLHPDHPARSYLSGRGFDPDVLAREYGVGFVVDAVEELAYLKKRIYIPVFFGGKLVGYQCRLSYDPDKNEGRKYMFPRGFRRAGYLYNFDRARTQPFVCLVEGATKVWRFGPEAVGSFGKIVTGQQIQLLCDNWDKVVVMLDPNARKESADVLSLLRASKPDAVLVDLPDGVEPDNVPADVARAFAFGAAARQGVDLLSGGARLCPTSSKA